MPLDIRPLIWIACVVAVIVYLLKVLKLLGELASAQERVAGALETVARKLEGGGQP